MNASDISEIIEREIDGNPSLSNAHGIDLRRCLVVPVKHAYQNSLNENETLELWLVLEEAPDDRSGYKIVFGEQSRMFGLATSVVDQPDMFLGFYGTFLETLGGM